MVADGCIVSGGPTHRSILFPRVRVNSYARVEESVLMDGVDVECVACAVVVASEAAAAAPPFAARGAGTPVPAARRMLIDPLSGRASEVPLYRREALAPGAAIAGPALIEEDDTTTVVAAGFRAALDPNGYIVLERERTP